MPSPQEVAQEPAYQPGNVVTRQLLEALKSPSSPEQQQQIMQILGNNPEYMSIFMTQRMIQNIHPEEIEDEEHEDEEQEHENEEQEHEDEEQEHEDEEQEGEEE